MMEEYTSVFACGAGAITKLVSPDKQVIERLAHPNIRLSISASTAACGRTRYGTSMGDIFNDAYDRKNSKGRKHLRTRAADRGQGRDRRPRGEGRSHHRRLVRGQNDHHEKAVAVYPATPAAAATPSLSTIFYKNPDDVPLDENGRRDLEGIESIDLAYLHECLEQLAAGRKARIPRFDFMLKKRADDYTPITLGDGDVAVIEGLHALNPIVYDRFVDERSLYRIYLYAHSVRVSEPRLLRRLVRDYHYRDASAEVTFSMWESVKRGEVENIEPFADTADLKINTYFHYEKAASWTRRGGFCRVCRRTAFTVRWRTRSLPSLRAWSRSTSGWCPRTSLLWEFLKK